MSSEEFYIQCHLHYDACIDTNSETYNVLFIYLCFFSNESLFIVCQWKNVLKLLNFRPEQLKCLLSMCEEERVREGEHYSQNTLSEYTQFLLLFISSCVSEEAWTLPVKRETETETDREKLYKLFHKYSSLTCPHRRYFKHNVNQW